MELENCNDPSINSEQKGKIIVFTDFIVFLFTIDHPKPFGDTVTENLTIIWEAIISWKKTAALIYSKPLKYIS